MGMLANIGSILHHGIKAGAKELFQSAKSRATDRHRATRPEVPAALETAHHAAQHEDEVGAPHGVELSVVGREQRNVGAEDAREQHGERQNDGQREDQDSWSFQSHKFVLPLWLCNPSPATTRKNGY